MTELEERLHASLTTAAGGAPVGGDLAGAARTRLRRRRRTVAATVASVAVVAALVPTALVLRDDGGPGSTEVAQDPGPTAGVSDGWRVVTGAGLAVEVPEDWKDGPRSAWCTAGGRFDAPLVERPGQVVPLIDCGEPQQGYGLTIGSSAAVSPAYESGHVWQYDAVAPARDAVEMYAVGSWLGYWYDEERMVSVNAGDRETVERILATVDTEWGTAEHEGVTVDLPPGWVELDQSGCDWPWPRFGPPSQDPCDPDAEGVSFYGSATFDPARGPGLEREQGRWSGYQYAGDLAVWVNVEDEAVGRRILGSREPAR